MEIYIHTGTLSVDNGARFPLTQYFDLATVLGVPALTGDHYGADRLEVPDEQWPLVEDLLKESCLLYKVARVDATWRNVRTDCVRNHLKGTPQAVAA